MHQQQDRRDERPRVTDADPPDEIHDRKAPRDRNIDPPDPDSANEHPADAKIQQHEQCERAGKSDQPRSTFPRLKGQASLRYQRADWQAGWKARFIGHSADLPHNAVNGGTLAPVLYHDVQMGTSFMGGKFSLAFGIDNVFDKQPPASAANNPINFDIYTYDVRGRYAYARISTKF